MPHFLTTRYCQVSRFRNNSIPTFTKLHGGVAAFSFHRLSFLSKSTTPTCRYRTGFKNERLCISDLLIESGSALPVSHQTAEIECETIAHPRNI
jgi:hypothetical protein